MSQPLEKSEEEKPEPAKTLSGAKIYQFPNPPQANPALALIRQFDFALLQQMEADLTRNQHVYESKRKDLIARLKSGAVIEKGPHYVWLETRTENGETEEILHII